MVVVVRADLERLGKSFDAEAGQVFELNAERIVKLLCIQMFLTITKIQT